MTLPKSHFFIRTRKNAIAGNPGKHPLVAVKIVGKTAYVAACSPSDNPCRAVARNVIDFKLTNDQGIAFFPSKDTLADILKAARVPRKVVESLDMDRAERAFERSLEA